MEFIDRGVRKQCVSCLKLLAPLIGDLSSNRDAPKLFGWGILLPLGIIHETMTMALLAYKKKEKKTTKKEKNKIKVQKIDVK